MATSWNAKSSYMQCEKQQIFEKRKIDSKATRKSEIMLKYINK